MLEHRRKLTRRLEEEAKRLAREHSGLHVRFAEVLGRRLSHLAGRPAALAAREDRVEITPRLLAFISGIEPAGFDSESWAHRLAEELRRQAYLAE